jgi:hypothetical protein
MYPGGGINGGMYPGGGINGGMYPGGGINGGAGGGLMYPGGTPGFYSPGGPGYAGGNGMGVYGPGVIGGGAGIGNGLGGPQNGGYWGGTGGYNGGGGYGVPGMNNGYYDQQQQQMHMQGAIMGQDAALAARMQGNAQTNNLGAQALRQNYQTAYNDLYSMGGAGAYGGVPYAAGNLSSNFSMGGYAGFNANLGGRIGIP